MVMRTLRIVFYFCLAAQAADVSCSHTPVFDTDHSYITPRKSPLAHPSPVRPSNYPTLMNDTNNPEGSLLPPFTHTAPGSPQKVTSSLFQSLRLGNDHPSQKRNYDESEISNLPGSADSTSPKRIRAESTPVDTTKVCRTIHFTTHQQPPHPSPQKESSSRASSGYASATITQTRLSRLSQRRVSSDSVLGSPFNPETWSPTKFSSTPFPPTPGSPSPQAWMEESELSKKSPAKLSEKDLKNMDIENPLTTSIEYQLLIEELQSLREAIQKSPAHFSTTTALQIRWENLTTYKTAFENLFQSKAHQKFAPRIQALQTLIQNTRKQTPTYTAAVIIYNQISQLEDELTQWASTTLYQQFDHIHTQIQTCIDDTEIIKQAAGTMHQQALAPLLEKDIQPNTFDKLVTEHKHALRTLKTDIKNAKKNATSPQIKVAFSELFTHLEEWISNHSEKTHLALLTALNPGSTWKETIGMIARISRVGASILLGGRKDIKDSESFSTLLRKYRRRDDSTQPYDASQTQAFDQDDDLDLS